MIKNFKMYCDRCGSETKSIKMSFFNTEECCLECIETEKLHPKYKEAKEQEISECKKGNYNYEGIGLPKDYSSWVKSLKK